MYAGLNEVRSKTLAEHVPEHVPPEMIRDFDFVRDLHPGDVYLNASKLHLGPDIFYTPRQSGHWVVTRYEDMETIFKSPAVFASDVMIVPKVDKPFRLLPVESNPPLHTDYRAILQPFFSPKKIGDLEQRAQELTLSLLDNFYARGDCEFISEFALKMPIGIFMSLVDLPDSDANLLVSMVETLVHGATPEEQQMGFMQMVQYMGQIIEERKNNLGDDMLSAILTAKVDGGRPMNEAEVLGMAVLLLVGGLETVVSAMGMMVRFLAAHDDHRKQLIESPKLIPAAIEEMMRRHQPGMIARELACDTEFKGVAMKKGDLIVMVLAAGGVDGQHFSDPFTVDFSRKDTKNLAFGRGPHACIGAYLARTELRVFLTEWLKQIPHFSIKKGTEPVLGTGFSHATLSVHLQWGVSE